MKKYYIQWLAMLFMMLLVFIVSCRDDDHPATPTTPADVNGLWNFSGTVTGNNCDWLQLLLPAEGDVGTQGIRMTQHGTALDGVSTGGILFGPNWMFTGTVTSNTFVLSFSEPYTEITEDGACEYYLEGGMRATHISANSSPGEVFYDIRGVGGDCAGNECAVIMTGTWTKQ